MRQPASRLDAAPGAAKEPPDARQRERALLDFAVSNSPVVFYIAGLDDGRLTFISSNAHALLGFPAETFEADPALGRAILHPDDVIGYERAVAALADAGEAVHEYRYRTAAGEYLWFRDHMRVSGAEGQPGTFVGCMVDITNEKLAEQRLDESEHQFRNIVETYPLPVWAIDIESAEILYQSPAASALFGGAWPADQPRSVLDHYVDPSERTRFLEHLDRHEQAQDYVVRMKRADGTPFWSSVTARVTRFRGRRVLISANRDLTEQRQRESELRQARETLEDAVESLSEGIALFDSRDRLVLCNQRFREYSDVAADTLVPGTPWETFLRTGADRGQYVDAVGRVEPWLEERRAGRYQSNWVFEQSDGRWFQATRRRTRDGGIVSIRTEITKLKELEQALRASEALVRRVLEACPVPVRMFRVADGAILYESPATRRLFHEPEDFESPARANYANPADRDHYIARLREHGSLDDYQLELLRSDGTRFWGAVSARLIDHDGEEVVVSSIHDLTHRRAVETEMARQREALHRSEKLSALGVLLAGVAHELNNPLSVVVGQAQLMQETAPDARIADRAERIGNAAARCARIVKTFIAMARQAPADCAPVSVNEIIEATMDVTGASLGNHGVEVVLDLDAEPDAVWADADQLNQVITSLVLNARQALEERPDGRRLQVRTRLDTDAEQVVVEIIDNGPGMPADVHTRIFEPFFTTREVGAGAGIGLPVCHRIIESHGGTMEVISAPDNGASFVIRLPADRPAPGRGDPNAAGDDGPSMSVLIIDDEPDFSRTLRDAIADHGHRVDVADSGMAALDLLEQRRFDVILSDLRMPSLDGPGLHRVLEEQRPELLDRLAFITGGALSPSMRRFLNSTGCPHMEKPASPDDVLAMLRGLAAKG